MYLQCHGIPTDGINDLDQLVLAVSQTAAKTALARAATGAALNAVGQPVSGAGDVGPSDHGKVEDGLRRNALAVSPQKVEH